MSALRDALQAITDLTERNCPTSALTPHLRQAHAGALAVSAVLAMVGGMEWAPERWSGIPTDGEAH
jgi:hypothetical protein